MCTFWLPYLLHLFVIVMSLYVCPKQSPFPPQLFLLVFCVINMFKSLSQLILQMAFRLYLRDYFSKINFGLCTLGRILLDNVFSVHHSHRVHDSILPSCWGLIFKTQTSWVILMRVNEKRSWLRICWCVIVSICGKGKNEFISFPKIHSTSL